MVDTRSGYFEEYKHSQVLLIDETEKEIPVSIHRTFIGPLRLWKEEILSFKSENRIVQKKLCFYTLEEPVGTKKKELHHVAVLLEPDQTLSSIAIQTTKKMADPFSQKMLQNAILAISIIMNVWLLVAANTGSEFLPVITLANAGWWLLGISWLKIIDLKQEEPAIYAGLFVLAKFKTYHPKIEEFVTVDLCRVIISDKVRISDQIPLMLTEEFNGALLALVEKKDADYEAEREQRLQAEKIIADQKETIAKSELRMRMIEKRAYRQGIKDAETPIITKTRTSDFTEKHPELIKAIMVFAGAIAFWGFMRFLSQVSPRLVIAVQISEIPWYAWAFTFLLAFLIIRWIWGFISGRY